MIHLPGCAVYILFDEENNDLHVYYSTCTIVPPIVMHQWIYKTKLRFASPDRKLLIISTNATNSFTASTICTQPIVQCIHSHPGHESMNVLKEATLITLRRKFVQICLVMEKFCLIFNCSANLYHWRWKYIYVALSNSELANIGEKWKKQIYDICVVLYGNMAFYHFLVVIDL